MEKKRSHFWVGFVIGALLCVVLWYYQKSTSSEDAALGLLDELAEEKRQVQALQRQADDEAAAPRQPASTETAAAPAETAAAPAAAAPDAADDLTAIRGIGPVYARRLQEAGIRTFAALAQQRPERVAELVGRKNWQAADPAEWIAAARALASSSSGGS